MTRPKPPEVGIDTFPLADVCANDPKTHVIEDRRATEGYVLIHCRFDGADVPALRVYNPREGMPGRIECASTSCCGLNALQVT